MKKIHKELLAIGTVGFVIALMPNNAKIAFLRMIDEMMKGEKPQGIPEIPDGLSSEEAETLRVT